MDILQAVIETMSANRLYDVERIQLNNAVKGDFVGSVTGQWIRLDESGGGLVSYRNKTYLTKPLGFTSITAGTNVELTFARGIYYSKW